jgi:hypothetical protein
MYPSPATASFHPKEGRASVAWNGQKLDLLCRVNRSAQRYKAVYRDGGLILTIPPGQTKRSVEDALREMAPALFAFHVQSESRAAAVKLAPLTLWGEPIRLRIVQEEGYLRAYLRDGELQLYGVNSEETSLALAACWMVQEAEEKLPGMLMARAHEMGLTVRKVTIKDMVSKWGSCTSAGAISLNFRLVMAPRDVTDYLLVHELAHLKELNHSPRFWALVEKHCPEYRQLDRWLTKHGHALMLALPRVSAAKARGLKLED